MTKPEIKMLRTDHLWAIVRSTRADGGFWLELSWAKEELSRRYAAKGKRLVGI